MEKTSKKKQKEPKEAAETPVVHPHALKDPCNDRPVKSVPLPPALPLSIKEVYDRGNVHVDLLTKWVDGLPDIKVIRDHLNLEGLVEKSLVIKLVDDAT